MSEIYEYILFLHNRFNSSNKLQLHFSRTASILFTFLSKLKLSSGRKRRFLKVKVGQSHLLFDEVGRSSPGGSKMQILPAMSRASRNGMKKHDDRWSVVGERRARSQRAKFGNEPLGRSSEKFF